MPLTAFSFPVNVFRFAVTLSTDPSAKPIAGFQQVDGLPSLSPPAEYRDGGSGGHPLKITGLNKATDVTLKRGVVDSSSLSGWISSVRDGRGASGATVHITLYNEAGKPVAGWTLKSAAPKKWSGPALSGSGGPIAIEELMLSSENISIWPPVRP